LNSTDPLTRHKLSAIRYSIGTAVFLAVLKLGVAWATHSLSILASAVDSLLDIAMSALNYTSVVTASRPEDRTHPYGRGKAESLASLFVGILTAFSVFYLVKESVQRFGGGKAVALIPLGIVVMLISLAATWFQVRRLKRVNQESQSLILDAETLHYASDFLTNAGVLIALIAIRFTGIQLIDPFVSIAIALYLIFSIGQIIFRSVSELMDRSLPEADRTAIDQIIRQHHPAIVDYHEFRTRRAGSRVFIEFHVVLRGEPTFLGAHRITESLTDRLRKRFTNAVVTIHSDPEEEMEAPRHI